ncbi:MAG: phosphotransferase, partial [Chloroflexi bacterium]|nr:phosphotransferase [Chloroflexota bacterium]
MPPAIRIDSWDDWVRSYNDVSIWRGLIDEICVRNGISYRRLRSASANTNAVFLLDHALVLKIYSPFWDEYDFERTLLEALRTEKQVPVVEVTGCGQVVDADGTSWDYLITRYCPARPFSELRPELSDSEEASLAEQLGRIAGALHELDANRFVSPSTDQVWSDLLTQRRRPAVSELIAAGVLDDAIVSPLDALL